MLSKLARELVKAGARVQTVVCPKDKHESLAAAAEWCRSQGFRTDRAVENQRGYLFPQFDPELVEARALAEFGKLEEGQDGDTYREAAIADGKAVAVFARAAEEVGPPGAGAMQHFEGTISAKRVERTEEEKAGAAKRAEEGEEEEEEDERTLWEVAISSEAEVERWFGIEVLGHDKGEIDFTRAEQGLAILVDHRGDQVGITVPGSHRVDKDKVQRAFARFSRSVRGREVEQDVADEIRTKVSVGYFPRARMILTEVREIGRNDQNEPITVDVYRTPLWQPAEMSLVSIPADTTVGVGRSTSGGGSWLPATDDGPTVEEETMSKEKDGGTATAEALEGRNAEVVEILKMCDRNNIAESKRQEFLASGESAEKIAVQILDLRENPPAKPDAAESIGDRMGEDRKRYSYVRAMRIGAGMHPSAPKDEEYRSVKFEGLEAEVHRELMKDADRAKIEYNGGILVPVDNRTEEDRWKQWEQRQAKLQKRTLDSKTATAGTETVFEQPGELIELLRNRAVVMQLGARLLAGLQGPVSFPKQTGGMTVYWVGENPGSDVTASDLALGIVNMAPKSMQGTTDYTRQLLRQSSIDVEMLVREDFAKAHALAVDKAAIHGKGSGSEPTGIYMAPDVNVLSSIGTPAFGDVVDAATEVAKDNADLGSLGWITTPEIAGLLMQTLTFPGASAAAGGPIWVGRHRDGLMNGYNASATNQVSSTMSGSDETGGSEHGAIFGNWSDLIFGTWAAMELIVDPFSAKKQGKIEVTSFQMADLVVRHGESFCKWTGATV